MGLWEDLEKDLRYAIKAKHRRLVVISGSDPIEMGKVATKVLMIYDKLRGQLLKKEGKVAYVFHDEFPDARALKDVIKKNIKEKAEWIKLDINIYEASNRLLGTTYQGLVLDLTHDLKPNDVGRLVEIVEGGGPVILLVPEWEKWDTFLTLFKQNLTVPQYPEPRHVFIRWFKRKILQHPSHVILVKEEIERLKGEVLEEEEWKPRKLKIPEKTKFPKEVYKMAITQDQINVIKEMEWMLGRKKKHRTLIIIADRGRGKSGALGIGLVGFVTEYRKNKGGFVKVVVTASDPLNVQTLFKLAMMTMDKMKIKYKAIKGRDDIVFEVHGEGWSIEYWPPLKAAEKGADLVVVDEAAGIPVPVLHKIWKEHKRSIFATTIHGYEGAGRGFNVRFLPALEEDKETELKIVKMHEPIRYAPNDPVERWLYDVLLLDAEPAELNEEDVKQIQEGKLKYLELDPEWLFSEEGEETLRQLFGIYVLAHYRNEPDDLAMIADAPHHTPRAVATESGKIVCALQLAEEGPIPDDMVVELLRGGKIPGNIIPDRFLKHLRIRDFAKTKGWRVVRIATHPEVQGKGIGTFALRKAREEAERRGYDWIASGFGVTKRLLSFWLKSGFLPVHMSPDRNPTSGEFTILVVNPITEKMKAMIWEANRLFRRRLLLALHDNYKRLEWDVAHLILSTDPIPIDPKMIKPDLHPVDIDRLWVYAYGPMTYEAASDMVYRLALAYWMQPRIWRVKVDKETEYVLIVKVLQAKSWEEAEEELGIRFRRMVALIKEFVRRALKHYWGIGEEGGTGVTWEEILERLAKGKRGLDL